MPRKKSHLSSSKARARRKKIYMLRKKQEELKEEFKNLAGNDDNLNELNDNKLTDLDNLIDRNVNDEDDDDEDDNDSNIDGTCAINNNNNKQLDTEDIEIVSIVESIQESSPSKPARGTFDEVPVKQERPDEAEIRELAAKMVEANKAKMQSMPAPPVRPANNNLPGGQTGILGYLTRKPVEGTGAGAAAQPAAAKSPSKDQDGKVPLDDESQRGRFGWVSFEKVHIPYIFRGSEKYCAVRILEAKLLNKYLNYLHSDIYSCTCIKSYFITEAESKLLNEINNKHCENQFGKEQFTTRDLVVRLSDAREFYTFLDVCYTKLTSNSVIGNNSGNNNGHNKNDKCGFIRINKESVVPYTIKDNLKYVPLFYFEGETDNLKLKAEKLEGWDLSYLKFCCKVQGIRNELFASETCSVISLTDIKSYFPPGTGFEDYWPSKVMDSQLFVNGKSGASAGGWTKQPPAPPANIINKQLQNNSTGKSSAQLTSRSSAGLQNIPRNSPANATTLQPVNQSSRSAVTTHPAHVSSNSLSANARSTVANNNAQNMLGSLTTVNGWTGLVGGQPAFQTAIVPQSNAVIRMTNSALIHNAYQQPSRSRAGGNGTAVPGQYPSYPVTTIQTIPQAQPTLRATAHSNQPNLGVGSTYTTSGLTNPNIVTASTYPQMLNLSPDQVQALLHPQSPAASALLSHSQRHTPPAHNAHNNAHPKTAAYPPPLIPVNGNSNNARDSHGRKQLILIQDAPVSNTSHVQPYGIQKALVEEKLVPCINYKPYIYSELLMTLPDFVSQYFPACDINNCRQVITEVLDCELYQGNRQQMKKLMEAGKCSSLTDELPLIHVRSIMKFMPQMKYMFRNMAMPPTTAHSNDEHPSKKRQRTS
ncbi:uncharacterized protein LOC123259273 isoform X2 [Cotesia glomerata]|uniref:uncharacterized protein LOC123259273 isoform X2 n=1 Tax=Cotesia glomerata TaxID=32391 RepID=UPI001D02F521|nr:uncharacterized protein LOC123259273 isoform X2 [Cotesia glomerata]